MASVVNSFLKHVLKNKVISQHVRFYPRWNHRRPLKVYTHEEYEEIKKEKNVEHGKRKEASDFTSVIKDERSKIDWNNSKPKKDKDKALNYEIKSKKAAKPLVANQQKTTKVETTDMLETVLDNNGNFIYTKMSNNDQRVGSIFTEVKSKKEKTKKDLLLLEGKRLIKDALLSGCQLKYILFSRKSEVEYLKPYLPQVGAKLYKMPYREMQLWSDLTTNPGIMGVFKIPNVEEFIPKEGLPFTLICDNIREPGNLGTVLRICAGAGCDKVILSKGCVNLWDSKVLRSATGTHFKLRILKNMEWDQIEKEISEDSSIFIADNKVISDGDGKINNLENILEKVPIVPYYGVDFKNLKHVTLIIGGETLGVSKNSYEIALKQKGARLNIPLNNDVDSLNVGVALGIIAFEFKKQLVQKV